MCKLTKNLIKTNNKFSLMVDFPACLLIISLKLSPVRLKPVRVRRGAFGGGESRPQQGLLEWEGVQCLPPPGMLMDIRLYKDSSKIHFMTVRVRVRGGNGCVTPREVYWTR